MPGFSVKFLICILHQVSKIINYLILLVQVFGNLLPLLFMAIFDKGKDSKAYNLILDNFLLLLRDFIKMQASGFPWLLEECWCFFLGFFSHQS